MTTSSSAWYVDFFRNDYLSVYGHLFTTERAEKETVFVAEVLELKPGARVLDLCCGPGRHALSLAQRGFRVTGLDLNQAYLDAAQRAAKAAKLNLETVAADMREIPFADSFDAIVNMYSSFGYLESEADDARVLQSVARASKPGGRFLLDMLNREWAVANYIPHDWHSGADGTLYVERRELDLASSRMHVSFTIIDPDGGRRDSVGHHIRLYSLTETTRLLEQAGLDVTGVFGGFEGEPYAIATRRMIICARKRPPA
ncbi:MAG TPA: class I SAM-dependent methyltransferase [Candidatus Binataceae bacterium]|nr:class I SAM-dependent methyltransferase [Candidatus Binataceae bacterium]